MKRTIGSCSICGGSVSVHDNWNATSIYSPVPTCDTCGATATNQPAPTIPMTPRTQPYQTITSTGGFVQIGETRYKFDPKSQSYTPVASTNVANSGHCSLLMGCF